MSKIPTLATRSFSITSVASVKGFGYSDLGDCASLPLANGNHTAELKLTSDGKIQFWINGVMKEEWE